MRDWERASRKVQKVGEGEGCGAAGLSSYTACHIPPPGVPRDVGGGVGQSISRPQPSLRAIWWEKSSTEH